MFRSSAQWRSAVVLIVALATWLMVQVPESALSMPSHQCGTPAADGEWQTGSQEDAGFDPAALCRLEEMLDQSAAVNVHAVVVVRHGKLIYETYGSGEDERWGRPVGVIAYGPQMQHDVRSISKSVVSLLVGIALDQSIINGLDQPVFAFFPNMTALRTPEKDRITIRHLLTMTSGFAWDEQRPYSRPSNDEGLMNRAADPFRFVLSKPVSDEAGVRWNYNGGNTQLLAGILQRATNKFLPDFAKGALFEPLGIHEFEWMKMPGSGEFAAASGLRLRPRDLAKIGELILRKGMWHGRRVVSEAWIEESTRAHVAHFDPVDSIGYGYHWWTDHEEKGDGRSSWISAMGLGGQRIYVHADHDLVVVIAAGLYADDRQERLPYDIFDKYVLAAIRE